MSAKPSAPRPVETDPVLLAVAQAPMGSPETEEEKRMVAAAKVDGRSVRPSDVERMLEDRARDET
jgi:hypothetical protein